MDPTQYLGIFLDESRDLLQILNERLLYLEKIGDDKVTVDEIFRAAHTLKGMAATMGFARLTELTHTMENVLDALRQGRIRLDPTLMDMLFSAVDNVGVIVEAIAEGKAEPRITDLTTRLASALENVESPATARERDRQEARFQSSITNDVAPKLDQYEQAVIAEALAHGFRVVWLKIELMPRCILKGVRAYMVINALESFGELIKAIPSVPDLEEERFGFEFVLLLVTKADDTAIRGQLAKISEVEAIALQDLQTSKPGADSLFTSAPPSESGQQQAAQPRDLTGIPGPSERSGDEIERGASTEVTPSSRIPPTVRVSTERLDSLVNLVGELVIDRTRLRQIATRNQIEEISEVVRHVGSVITDIHAVVMKLRMTPVERVFNRFPRMVRDLGRELGKDLRLAVVGQETELDRLMIDEIADPLLHLLRNSVDHGLEMPDERELLGKPRVGTVFLRARHEGNHVIIEVEDDGRGMNPDKIKQKALDKALISPEEAGRLTDKQSLDLIFTPGFSMRDEATDISGRGVGMDAVKSKALALGGALDLTSHVGKGTQVTIILPLTLAIIQCMLVEVGREIYAIPISFVEDAHDLDDLVVQSVQEEEIVLLRGFSLPLVRLRRWFEVTGDETTHETAVVVVRVGSRRAGLVVDRLFGQQEVVIKPISRLVGHVPHISGASILGDGRMALILDAATML